MYSSETPCSGTGITYEKLRIQVNKTATMKGGWMRNTRRT